MEEGREARLRLAIVGLGRGAALTAPGLIAHSRIELIAGCDPNADAREAFTAKTGLSATGDFADLLSDAQINAIYVASPHEYHAEHAIAAARAGKHVLVEKPMALRLGEARDMVTAADQVGVTLMVGPSHGYDPPVALAAELAWKAGGARLIHTVAFTDFLYRPRRASELARSTGGGVVFSQASHQIDMARVIAGAPITFVRARLGEWDSRASDGAYAALLGFANGATASITYSGHSRYDNDDGIGEMGRPKPAATHSRTRAALATGGENSAKKARGFAAGLAGPAPYHERLGRTIVCCPDADLELTSEGVIVHDERGSTLHFAPLAPAPRYHVAECFVRAVLDRETPGFDGHWGLATLAACHAIVRSAEGDSDERPDDLITEMT